MRVLCVSAEVAPFAKRGGLADVAASLPKALGRLGHEVRIALPKYGMITEKLETILQKIEVPLPYGADTASVKHTTMEGTAGVYFIEKDKYFDREGIYDYPDDGERFIFFCRCVLEMLKAVEWQPDVIHCNTWPTALIPVYLKTLYRDDPFFRHTGTVYTIHSLAFQGKFPMYLVDLIGLRESACLEKLELNDQLNFMKGGIICADMLNTVSNVYREEVCTTKYGEGLHEFLRARSDDFWGILNGIDYDIWDPAATGSDEDKTVPYDLNVIEGKQQNKRDLQERQNLHVAPETPIIGMVSRLVDQKGLDLVTKVFPDLMRLDLQFVLLGYGDRRYHDFFSAMPRKYPGRVGVSLGVQRFSARKIYAGSDMLLSPSHYEPCGLAPMIALRYGTVPIVRKTGGLAETIIDYDPETNRGNGFVFEDHSAGNLSEEYFSDKLADKLLQAIERAVETYANKQVWEKLAANAISVDFSWEDSAKKYVQLFRRALEKKCRSDKAMWA